jgi:hypothetical protein
MFEIWGFGGLVILALSIWAALAIVTSPIATWRKVKWCALVLFVPLLGVLVWITTGPGGARAT